MAETCSSPVVRANLHDAVHPNLTLDVDHRGQSNTCRICIYPGMIYTDLGCSSDLVSLVLDKMNSFSGNDS